MEIWTYFNLPGMAQLRGRVSMVFMRVTASQAAGMVYQPLSVFSIENIANAGTDFVLVHVGDSLFGDQRSFLNYLTSASYDTFESQFNIGDVRRSPGDRLDAEEEKCVALREEVGSSVSFGRIDASLHYWVLRGGNDNTYMPMAIHLAGDQIKDTPEIVLLAEMARDDKIVAELSDTLNLKKLDPIRLLHAGILYQTRMKFALFKEGAPVSAAQSRRLQFTTRGQLTKISYAMTLPLSRFTPGIFQLRIETKAHISGARASREANFRVVH